MTIKTAKIIYNTFNTLCFITGMLGFLLVIGAASGLELDRITFTQCTVLAIVGFINCFISYKAFHIQENYKNYINKKSMKNNYRKEHR